MNYKFEGQWGQESMYTRFCRIEDMRDRDKRNADRLSHWYWRRSHYACGQQEFPLIFADDRNKDQRILRRELMRIALAIIATVAWLAFVAWPVK